MCNCSWPTHTTARQDGAALVQKIGQGAPSSRVFLPGVSQYLHCAAGGCLCWHSGLVSHKPILKQPGLGIKISEKEKPIWSDAVIHLPILFVQRHSNVLAPLVQPPSHSSDPISRVSPVHSDHQPLFSTSQAGFSLICLHFIGSPCPNSAFAAVPHPNQHNGASSEDKGGF